MACVKVAGINYENYMSHNHLKGDNETLRLFEKKVLRKIYGPVFNNTERKLEIRTNAQLHRLYRREDMV